MKNFSILTLLAVSAMLIMPGIVSAACELSPVQDTSCPVYCEGDPIQTWCDPQSNVAGGDWCFALGGCSGMYCTGFSNQTCGGEYPYCYCASTNSCGCNTTAKVDMLDFSAERSAEGVKLNWKTAQEIECGAFKILRCETATPGACELWSHAELGITVPCEDNPMGADYSTVDTTAKKDQSYSYYLREYDTTDRIFEYGPLFMSIDDSIMNTGHIEPFESTFEILTAPSSDDDDDDEDTQEEPESGSENSDDSEGGCGF